MMFPQLARFTDLGLLLLRLMVGLVFVTSGYSHLKDPEGRSKSTASGFADDKDGPLWRTTGRKTGTAHRLSHD